MMRRGLWIAIGVVVVIFLVILMVFGSYVSAKNQMVAKQEAVKAQWSQVDVVLQRRADLIPNLVSTVKGYATHEEKVFDDIANARAALLNAKDPSGKIQANGQLDGALGRLLAISENYPNLKADQNFLSLQAQLEGSENRIAVERRRYNETLARLQHLHPAVSQQHLGGNRGLPAGQRVLRGERFVPAGSGGEVLEGRYCKTKRLPAGSLFALGRGGMLTYARVKEAMAVASSSFTSKTV